MTQSKKYAVTGGIGSGKSAFSQILRSMGYPVFSCDEIYAALRKEEPYRGALVALFPDCAKGASPDFSAISRKVFSDETALKKLNALSHPLIIERLTARMQSEPVSFAEVPLLYEGNFEGLFDGVVALVRNREERIGAVIERDKLTRDEVLARMSRQVSEEELRGKNCLIIENDGTLDDLRAKAERALALLGIR